MTAILSRELHLIDEAGALCGFGSGRLADADVPVDGLVEGLGATSLRQAEAAAQAWPYSLYLPKRHGLLLAALLEWSNSCRLAGRSQSRSPA